MTPCNHTIRRIRATVFNISRRLFIHRNPQIVYFTLFVFGSGLCFSSWADPYRPAGDAFRPQATAEIAWAANLDGLPKGLWVYMVVPQRFPMAAVSNALAMAGLQMKDLVHVRNPPVADGDFVRFQAGNKKRLLHYLDISPALGWMECADLPGSWKDPIEDVPGETELKPLALDCLFRLGIDRSLIAAKPRNLSFTTTQRGSQPEIISQRGIFLVRRIDGLEERGFCFSAAFGSHARLLSFELNWRNLQLFESHSVATTNQMVNFLKNGCATLLDQPGDMGNVCRAEKLTVTKFTPLYFNEPGIVPVNFEYPYAELDVVADFGNSNTTTFYLNCPILSTNAVSN